MSLLLDALKKAAEEKEHNKLGPDEGKSAEDHDEAFSPEVDEELLLDQESVPVAGEELPAEEVFDLELPEETVLTESKMIEAEPEKKQKPVEKIEKIIEQAEVSQAANPAPVVSAKEKPSAIFKSGSPEQKAPDYDHHDARKILEISQKRYRNSQRMAYYGLYIFAALLFFSGSYLYYTAEILDNSDRPVFRTSNKPLTLPKTTTEKKIEQQVSIAKAKLAEIDNSEKKEVLKKVVKSKKIIKPVEKEKKITITRQKKSDPISLLLQKAYAHYQSTEYQKSEELYQSILLREPRQRDALLGRAAIAVVNKEYAAARNFYQQILHYYPKDSIATAALVDLSRQEMTSANESQLNTLLRNNPDAAHVYFSLGLLYAKQQRIKESQQAFFDAYAIDKKADYAYNLAVMLDKLGQVKAALSYYKQASALSDKNASNFNEKIALERIAQLEAGNE